MVTNGDIHFLHLKIVMAAINKNIFFQNVSQLDKMKASPKHPQSEIGLSIASQSVNGVIKLITANIKRGVILRRIPKNR